MENGKRFRYILVGNIIDKHYYGEAKEIRSGTKHFRTGAKVYLFPEYGGMGHEKMPVFGLPRKSFKRINVVIATNLIKNVRVVKTYNPKLVEKIDQTPFYSYNKDHPDYTEDLRSFAESINENNIELRNS